MLYESTIKVVRMPKPFIKTDYIVHYNFLKSRASSWIRFDIATFTSNNRVKFVVYDKSQDYFNAVTHRYLRDILDDFKTRYVIGNQEESVLYAPEVVNIKFFKRVKKVYFKNTETGEYMTWNTKPKNSWKFWKK